MQAITTTYTGPTNTRGSRIIAKTEGGRVAMPYRHELDTEGNHVAAAELLLETSGWTADGLRILGSGSTKGGDVYVHVLTYGPRCEGCGTPIESGEDCPNYGFGAEHA